MKKYLLLTVLLVNGFSIYCQAVYQRPSLDKIQLSNSIFKERAALNRTYMISLKNENLLQNFYQEAGLWNPPFRMTAVGPSSHGDDIHWGWESPTCKIRGHFLGHWLSAASYLIKANNDQEIKVKAEAIVAELAKCQQRNGGEWVGSIPEKYLYWLAEGKGGWAPQYTMHKTLMGLIDMYTLANNKQALEILENQSKWYTRWTNPLSKEKMDDVLDTETGGMLEVWADLYEITGKKEHLDLMNKYYRGRLFDRLLKGEDVLTNHHANTTIPEIQGAARAYEVTKEEKWRKIVEAYWKSAVTDRGFFATGGQTEGESWTPPNEFSARLSKENQEHCTVFNLMRVADYLFRWSGNVQYLDYIERNLYNGVLAQQNQNTGMVAYYLPLEAGGKKVWGHPTFDFWCCHGSLVQAQTQHTKYIYYQNAKGLLVSQYIPSTMNFEANGQKVIFNQKFDIGYSNAYAVHQGENAKNRPKNWTIDMAVNVEKPTEFELTWRLPWWISGKATLIINGKEEIIDQKSSSLFTLKRIWNNDKIRLILPKSLTVSPLPDMPNMVAFMEGPIVLAGICQNEETLSGDLKDPKSILTPDNEIVGYFWHASYRTMNQDKNFRFVPLYEITDENYTVYFPIKKNER